MICIFKTSLSSSSDSPEGLTTELGQQTSPGRRGFGPKTSGHRSPGGGAAILLNKRLTLPFLAFVAVLAAGLLFLLPGGLLQAQATSETYYHHENDEGPIVTLTARDPEGVSPVVWSLLTVLPDPVPMVGGAALMADDFADEDSFTVENGVLSFDGKPDFEGVSALGNNDEYKVVVVASDGGKTNWVQYFKVTVNVLDVEETGEVEWTVGPEGTAPNADVAPQDLLEFQAGALLTASVTDPDRASTTANNDNIDNANITWKWYRSSSRSAMGTMIDGATANTYTVSDEAGDDDRGMYLRAVATYTDRRGNGKTAELVSLHPVRPAKVEDNTAPMFTTTAIARDIQEGSAGRNVGAPVTAMDADGDVRNYTLSGTIPQVGTENAFKIDQATGQIMTATALDYDADGATRTFTLTVRATDSAGGATETPDDNNEIPDDATVTITLLNVNEAPGFVAPNPDPDADLANIVQGMAADKAEEGMGVTWTAAVSDYGVDDPEGVDIGEGKWSLEGADAALFKLTGTTDNIRTLEFKEKADFEMPMDSNRDNIYEVTVVASDGQMMAKRAVTVKITDSDEAGMIMLSDENPVTGTAVEATLGDSDGEVINVKWTWYALASVPVDDDALNTALNTATALKGAMSDGAMSSYTPTADDIGMHLVARAMYMDRTEDENNTDEVDTVPGEGAIRFNNTATSEVTAAVIDDPANVAPTFDEGTTATRYVEENSHDEMPNRAASETVGSLLMISDDDLPNDSHTYMLGGTDAASFEVNAVSDTTNDIHGAQLMTKAALDYEDKKTYTVVVTVEDGSGESNDSARITVTIQVKDLDEKPVIQGNMNVDHNENDEGPVVTLTARDPEGVSPVVWSLLTVLPDPVPMVGGAALMTDDFADEDSFTVENGVLSFDGKPDFEGVSALGNNDEYKVVVVASDGGKTNWVQYFKVTVNVLDVEETGEVEWTVGPEGTAPIGEPMELLEFQAGALLTASVTDPDRASTTANNDNIDNANITWRWYRSSSLIENTPTNGTYTVSDTATPGYPNGDVGQRLRVVATYTDRRGDNKTAEFVSLHPVRPAKVEDNTAPEFAPDEHTRRVQEGSAGRNVGAPVTAMDADGDVRNYTLSGTIPQVGTENAFKIDQATGQIMTATALDYDADGATRTFTLTVRATDSAGGATETPDDNNEIPDDATVTITLLNVNEAPGFVAPNPDPDADLANIVQGMAADKAEEGMGVTWTAAVSDYGVDDPEGVDIGEGKWSLEGADAALFKLTGTTDNIRTLEFKEKADFEMPMDSNRDNIYEVTVVASDGADDGEAGRDRQDNRQR